MALPDYPMLKRDISELLLGVLEAAKDMQLGPFAKSPTLQYHEGDKVDFATVGGEVKEVTFKDFGFSDDLDLKKFSSLGIDEIFEIMARTGTQLGRELAKAFYEHLSAELDEAGQTVSAGG